ncbi:MAG: CDP-archaeol synthase [Gammaproteobacteria bacterium]|nr:CDP-archaeol synthase [Gammaproteobacteria bacterium]
MPTPITLLCLILAANAAPILLWLALGERLGRPLDGGHTLPDGRPVFGPGKTWRGVASAPVACAALAALLGLPPALGAAIGLAAMGGDLLSSFLKRRLGLASSRPAPGLDQIPESLFPALLAAGPLGLGPGEVLLVMALFFVLELVLSHLLYRLGLRRYPI